MSREGEGPQVWRTCASRRTWRVHSTRYLHYRWCRHAGSSVLEASLLPPCGQARLAVQRDHGVVALPAEFLAPEISHNVFAWLTSVSQKVSCSGSPTAKSGSMPGLYYTVNVPLYYYYQCTVLNKPQSTIFIHNIAATACRV